MPVSTIDLRFERLQLRRRYPFVISRGKQPDPVNLFVLITRGGVTGIGEMPIGPNDDADEGARQIAAVVESLPPDVAIASAWRRAREFGIAARAQMALDVALWDALAKSAGMPLHRLLGLEAAQVPTSVTIGIGAPDEVRERTRDILSNTGARMLKIKLGSPQGLDHDTASFAAIREAAAPFGVGLRVDANGGWDVAGSRRMMRLLADAGVAYVEQPLPAEADEDLPAVFADRPLPLYVDESCRVAADVPRLAHAVDGVNAKLGKAGGISETLRIVAAARAHGLGTMIGCFCESSIAIGAGAALGSLFDHIDLDAHLLLREDPGVGVRLVDGRLVPPDVPGHGGSFRHARS